MAVALDELAHIKMSQLYDLVYCPICMDVITDCRVTKGVSSKKYDGLPICGTVELPAPHSQCYHRFCKTCIERAVKEKGKGCPQCRKDVKSRRELREDKDFDRIIEVLVSGTRVDSIPQVSSTKASGAAAPSSSAPAPAASSSSSSAASASGTGKKEPKHDGAAKVGSKRPRDASGETEQQAGAGPASGASSGLAASKAPKKAKLNSKADKASLVKPDAPPAAKKSRTEPKPESRVASQPKSKPKPPAGAKADAGKASSSKSGAGAGAAKGGASMTEADKDKEEEEEPISPENVQLYARPSSGSSLPRVSKGMRLKWTHSVKAFRKHVCKKLAAQLLAPGGKDAYEKVAKEGAPLPPHGDLGSLKEDKRAAKVQRRIAQGLEMRFGAAVVPPSEGAAGDEGGACRTIGAVFDAAGWRRTEGKGSKRHEVTYRVSKSKGKGSGGS